MFLPHNYNQIAFVVRQNKTSSAFSSAIRAGKPFVTPIKCLINIISFRKFPVTSQKKKKPQKNRGKKGKHAKLSNFQMQTKLANKRRGSHRICYCLMWQHARMHTLTHTGQLIKGVNWLNDACSSRWTRPEMGSK